MPQETPVVKRKATWSVNDELSLLPSEDSVQHLAADVNGDYELKKAKIQGVTAKRWTLKPVLAHEYLREVETVPVYVAAITDRQKTSQLVRMLSVTMSLGNLQHLKRVRTSSSGLEIIICQCPEGHSGTTQSLTDILGGNTPEGLSPHVKVVNVPKHTPMTRPQYECSNCMWPTQFHENKHIAQVLNDELFDNGEKLELESYMRLAVTAAKKASTCDAVTIVNPSSHKVLVTTVRNNNHPLQHAVLTALDLVARLQGGGAWNLPDGCILYDVSQEDQRVDGQEPYLCTGYDVYVTQEPCLMCSMALVHSRIRRLFYGCRSPAGALGSQHKLHVQKGLNHHFEVWEGVLEYECSALSVPDS
ncbi:probable inactive tRNA-specific adenosine deaminase-like protein 3 isoform X2 [Ornithodoros turicata]|uniref:probable inactive tRNA-specific adenosine deaminase-like protein 3 isoform X2 n=1 Tax=Ornithodoros turicata TaxID=34597 RepID=UPI00313932B7